MTYPGVSGRYTLAGTAYSGLAITPGADTRGIGVGLVHKF